jgi:hypothetical protein
LILKAVMIYFIISSNVMNDLVYKN